MARTRLAALLATVLLFATLAAARAPGAFLDWRESAGVQSERYSLDGLSIRLTGRGPAHARTPVITVASPAGTVRVAGVAGAGPAAARLGVGRIDPGSPAPQVLFLSYSGGAHCCTTVRLIEVLNGAWRTVDLGTWNSAALADFPVDVDGDGVADLVFEDNRFLYAFASYAGSATAPLIQNIRRGQVIDVSSAPRYLALHAARLKALEASCAQGANGACAAYVAVAARLGRTQEAWRFMLDHYDRKDEWPLPSACRPRAPAGQACPKDQEIHFNSYPEALRRFLSETGYWPPGETG